MVDPFVSVFETAPKSKTKVCAVPAAEMLVVVGVSVGATAWFGMVKHWHVEC